MSEMLLRLQIGSYGKNLLTLNHGVVLGSFNWDLSLRQLELGFCQGTHSFWKSGSGKLEGIFPVMVKSENSAFFSKIREDSGNVDDTIFFHH